MESAQVQETSESQAGFGVETGFVEIDVSGVAGDAFEGKPGSPLGARTVAEENAGERAQSGRRGPQ